MLLARVGRINAFACGWGEDDGKRSLIAVQFTRSKEGLGGVLRKVAGEDVSAFGVGNNNGAWHPVVQHMLLVDTDHADHWFDSHPPLAERIRRIYGRPMAAISMQAFEPTRPSYFS